MAIENIVGNLNNLEKVHVYDIIRIQNNSTGKKLNLPSDIEASNSYGDITIYRNKKQNIKKHTNEYILHNGVNEIGEVKGKVTINLIDMKEKLNCENNELVKYFDYDKIQGEIILRYRRNGDRFSPLGMKGSKKLKDLFIDLKLPKERRDEIPLICFGDHIAWILGYRVSELFKVDESTENILEVKFEGEEL
jgi:tRNA(Ile)-lysidine synthase